MIKSETDIDNATTGTITSEQVVVSVKNMPSKQALDNFCMKLLELKARVESR